MSDLPPDAPFDVVRDALRLLHRARVVVAFSGGLDSTVLLQLATKSLPAGRVRAVHVHHGLSDNADDWARWCRARAEEVGVDFRLVRVDARARGRSPEDAARRARYAALRRQINDGEFLLTAHHGDDQALTVLLQLLRGAGPRGLAGMPERAPFGRGVLMRPLLAVSRRDIETYARAHALQWVEDDGNASSRYDRNYLRLHLAPVLQARWPQWSATLARAAGHQADAAALLAEAAAEDFAACRALDETPPVLSRPQLARLAPPRRRLVLRHWLDVAGLRMASAATLERIEHALDGAMHGGTVAAWLDDDLHCAVKLYRDFLYLSVGEDAATPRDRPWPAGDDLDLPDLGTRLSWRELLEQAPALKGDKHLSVRFRKGGERCLRRSLSGAFHQELKKIFQQHGCPPWRRARVPLVYSGDTLRLVWGYTACG